MIFKIHEKKKRRKKIIHIRTIIFELFEIFNLEEIPLRKTNSIYHNVSEVVSFSYV